MKRTMMMTMRAPIRTAAVRACNSCNGRRALSYETSLSNNIMLTNLHFKGGNNPTNANRVELEDFLNEITPITKCRLASSGFATSRKAAEKEAGGVNKERSMKAFVEYQDQTAAICAISELHLKFFNGRRLFATFLPSVESQDARWGDQRWGKHGVQASKLKGIMHGTYPGRLHKISDKAHADYVRELCRIKPVSINSSERK